MEFVVVAVDDNDVNLKLLFFCDKLKIISKFEFIYKPNIKLEYFVLSYKFKQKQSNL